VKKTFCLLIPIFLALRIFAQTENTPQFQGESGLLPGFLDFAPSFSFVRPIQMADGDEQVAGPITEGKPQWVKDLRRGEIVAFGSFPFTVFFTRTFMDLYRTASHSWDRRYAPWPFKAAGAVAMTNGELAMMFTIAVSASLVISVADYLIVRHKRYRGNETE
jgi:hypothetical protein